MAYKILQEMIEKGIAPDLPVYTTLINSFRMGRKLEKCWELNKMLLKSKVELDETYVGVMLKVHAAVIAKSYRHTTQKWP
jgi:pentatricopeptide repeat protein